jgi:hypothetical protein
LSAFQCKLKLCAALLVAGLATDVTSAAGWRRVYRAFALWFREFPVRDWLPPERAAARYAVCQTCPIFYRPLGTCGSPLSPELKDQGCWCFMYEKVRLRSARCWLDETLGDDAPYGWKMYGVE